MSIDSNYEKVFWLIEHFHNTGDCDSPDYGVNKNFMDLKPYIVDYISKRINRCKEFGAIFLPLEFLREKATNKFNLSVSFSNAGIYLTKRAPLYRAVKVKYKYLIIPYTVSVVLTIEEFIKHFGKIVETQLVDDEEFYFIPSSQQSSLIKIKEEIHLSRSYVEIYEEGFL